MGPSFGYIIIYPPRNIAAHSLRNCDELSPAAGKQEPGVWDSNIG
jgi:hypothetical protein